MRKIVYLSILKNHQFLCKFNNGEERVFDFKTLGKNKYTEKILSQKLLKKAKIGEFGEIQWEGVAEIENLKGEKEPCAYDISPDFVYLNSTLKDSFVFS